MAMLYPLTHVYPHARTHTRTHTLAHPGGSDKTDRLQVGHWLNGSVSLVGAKFVSVCQSRLALPCLALPCRLGW